MSSYPLHEACQVGDKEAVKNLIKKKWKVNEVDDRQWTPLHCAANARQLEICKFLLSKNANPSLMTSNNATALHYLCRMRDHALLLTILKLFLEKGADVNHPNTYANTPLHEASLRGSVTCMQFLLKNSAKIDEQNSYGETPLHQAIRGGNYEAVELLLRKNARTDLVGRDGSALEQAKRILDNTVYEKIEELIKRLSFKDSALQSIVNYETLPPRVVEMATAAKLTPASIDANFKLFSEIVRFVAGKDAKVLPDPIDQDKVIYLTEDPLATYKIESISSSCISGTVMIAKNLKTEKLVSIRKASNKTTQDFKNNTNELRLLKRCQHVNVVAFYEAYNVVDAQEIWAITERLEGGSLHEMINRVKLKESEMAYIVLNMLEGLKHLHSKYVVHRDIKSQNITLTVTGDVKIVDFGLAMNLRKGSAQGVAGSPFYMAPEVIRREPQSFPVDIWSLGITIVEMVNGEPPNADNKLRAMYSTALGETKANITESTISNDLLHFLDSCLTPDASSRPSCEMLLKHRWLEQMCGRDEMKQVISKVFKQDDLDLKV